MAMLLALFLALAVLALAYQALALALLARPFGPQTSPSPHPPAISLLKPLYGAEPYLAENLASFLAQDYGAPVQMVLATNAPDDPAAAAVGALQAGFPQADLAYHPGPRMAGANGKMGSCAAALPLCRHAIIALSDSDMVAPPHYLASLASALANPDAGLATCLYAGRGDAGWASQLGALIISSQHLPNIVLGARTGLAHPAMGSTLALRRVTLDAIGGFARFADVLADDHAIGAAIRARGQTIAIAPVLLLHAGQEADLRALWRQHLRWAATIRTLAGLAHVGSLITHALPLALLAALWGAPLLVPAAALALRLATLARARAMVAQHFPQQTQAKRDYAALPLADLFAFAVFCASLFARKIDWRGTKLTMQPHGQISCPTPPGNTP